MKKVFLFMLLFVATVVSASAQAPQNERDMQQWLREVREYKHSFLAQKLDLSRDQQNKFFPIYDKMDDELAKLNAETRALEKKINDAPKGSVTDLEYDMAIQALFQLKAKEAEIENSYLDSFKGILSKEQLFKLKSCEKKFMMNMMRRHHEIKNKNKKQ